MDAAVIVAPLMQQKQAGAFTAWILRGSAMVSWPAAGFWPKTGLNRVRIEEPCTVSSPQSLITLNLWVIAGRELADRLNPDLIGYAS
jgi:hypothetical protein